MTDEFTFPGTDIPVKPGRDAAVLVDTGEIVEVRGWSRDTVTGANSVSISGGRSVHVTSLAPTPADMVARILVAHADAAHAIGWLSAAFSPHPATDALQGHARRQMADRKIDELTELGASLVTLAYDLRNHPTLEAM